MNRARDTLFQEFFGRVPTQEELQRFDRIGALMEIEQDDSLWYFILVNEFYDDRMKNRLADVERVADKALKITEAAGDGENTGSLAAQKGKGDLLRSWGFLMSFTVLLCAAMFNAGYVMGSGGGKNPFWLRPENGLRRMVGWFLNVPSGWIFLLGSGPFLFEVYSDSMKKITANKRFGIEGKENTALYVKSLASLAAMGIIGLLMLYLTGLNLVSR